MKRIWLKDMFLKYINIYSNDILNVVQSVQEYYQDKPETLRDYKKKSRPRHNPNKKTYLAVVNEPNVESVGNEPILADHRLKV